jgi:hypothetical protein
MSLVNTLIIPSIKQEIGKNLPSLQTRELQLFIFHSGGTGNLTGISIISKLRFVLIIFSLLAATKKSYQKDLFTNIECTVAPISQTPPTEIIKKWDFGNKFNTLHVYHANWVFFFFGKEIPDTITSSFCLSLSL